ncbi:MAG: 2-dehydro-3-deoxygalactonokinase [Alphaproteobacteria bacterium]|nr:2-dehydro-3-deoxygalactonokinase [Alphaproteobacteria bacterium]
MTGSALDWIALDWGTSNCRAWAMARNGSVLTEARSDKGMGQLTRDEFEPALLEMIGPWLDTAPVDVLACGMLGARQGWVEAPYRTVPCSPVGGDAALAKTIDPRLRVRVISGLKQVNPADVMRGEETQIAGWLAQNPSFDGVLCLPGTHAKWVQISASEVVSFRTFLTGELFAAIKNHTVLRHSMGSGWDEAAFEDALTDAMSRPEAIAQRLFSIRAEGLIAGLSPDAATARLSGLLIGAELAAARPYWLGQNVAMIGTGGLGAHYARALSLQGVTATSADAEAMTRAGLIAARDGLSEETT